MRYYVPGVDLLISRSLSFEIKDNLDSNILQNLEKQLFFEHGMSIKLSIEHFENLHNILKNNLSIDIEAFEKSCVDKIIKVSRTKNNYTVKIIDKKLSEKILDFFGDPETRCILMSLMTKSLTISEILKISNVLPFCSANFWTFFKYSIRPLPLLPVQKIITLLSLHSNKINQYIF